MKKEYFLNAVRMLKSQLKEEEESYTNALQNDKQFFELKQIKQRIKALKELLLAMENKQLPLSKTMERL